MKSILFGLLFLSLIGYSQDTLNRTTPEGFKYGYWKTFHENGQVKEEGKYSILKEKLTETDLFFYGFTSEFDSIKMRSVKNGLWKYYDAFGDLIKDEYFSQGESMHRRDYLFFSEGRLKPHVPYQYNSNKNEDEKLAVFLENYNLHGQVNETRILKLICENKFRDSLSILVHSSSSSIKLKNEVIKIPPHSIIESTLIVNVDSGINSHSVQVQRLSEPQNEVSTQIRTYSHKLSSREFEINPRKSNIIQLYKKDKISYFRELEESELRIFTKSAYEKKEQNIPIEPILVLPISFEMNQFDISKLKPGNYVFSIMNYSRKSMFYRYVELR